MDANSPVRKAVAYESDVSERVQVTVLFNKIWLFVSLDTAHLFYIKNSTPFSYQEWHAFSTSRTACLFHIKNGMPFHNKNGTPFSHQERHTFFISRMARLFHIKNGTPFSYQERHAFFTSRTNSVNKSSKNKWLKFYVTRWTTPVSRKRIAFHNKHIGTTKLKRVIV